MMITLFPQHKITDKSFFETIPRQPVEMDFTDSIEYYSFRVKKQSGCLSLRFSVFYNAVILLNNLFNRKPGT